MDILEITYTITARIDFSATLRRLHCYLANFMQTIELSKLRDVDFVGEKILYILQKKKNFQNCKFQESNRLILACIKKNDC